MFTIFTTPRPFRDQFDVIQRNSLQSWLKIIPRPEIILFEDEEKTTSKVAAEFSLSCLNNVKCDEFGTPLLEDVFKRVKKLAKNEIIAQVNSDIILLSDFPKAIESLKDLMKGQPFFMTGQRWNLDIKETLQFNKRDWETKLRDRLKKEGKLHRLSGMDYWIFPRDLQLDIPSFVVGRPSIDSWLIYKTRSLGLPVIDATQAINVIHQNHNYPRKKDYFFEIEEEKNIRLAGGLSSLGTLRDANWLLTPEGLKRPKFPRRILVSLTLFYPWRILLLIKRRLQRFLKKAKKL